MKASKWWEKILIEQRISIFSFLMFLTFHEQKFKLSKFDCVILPYEVFLPSCECLWSCVNFISSNWNYFKYFNRNSILNDIFVPKLIGRLVLIGNLMEISTIWADSMQWFKIGVKLLHCSQNTIKKIF